MKRRVICIAAMSLCVAMTSMAYAKEIETTTEEDEDYYTLEVKRKPYDIEKIASVVFGKIIKEIKSMKGTGIMKMVRLKMSLNMWSIIRQVIIEHIRCLATVTGIGNIRIFIWNQNSQKKEMRKIRKRRLTMARS